MKNESNGVVLSNTQEILDICTKELLIPFEGYAKKLPNGDCQAYPDPATGSTPYTIGFGSTTHPDGTTVMYGEIWTLQYATECKQKVLQGFLLQLLHVSPFLVVENPRRVASVLSWVYNCGMGNYKISTFKKKIDEGNWIEAAEQCKKWNRAGGRVMKGLTRRRLAEANMLLSN